MKLLKFFWRQFKNLSLIIGNIISWIILFIFYYTIFLLFALPFKIFSKNNDFKLSKSNWIVKESALLTLDNFKDE